MGEEEMPPTGLTLAGAKEWLNENFVKHTITPVNAKAGLYFGLDTWDVKALEEVPNINSLRKRNFRLYTAGLEEDSKAWWESTMGPMSAPLIPSLPTFLDDARDFLRSEVKADKIKAGELLYGDDEMERTTAIVIDVTNKEKHILIKRINNKFSMEDYTPVTIAKDIATK